MNDIFICINNILIHTKIFKLKVAPDIVSGIANKFWLLEIVAENNKEDKISNTFFIV